MLRGKGAFGVPPGEIVTETPDGVNKTYAGGEVRNSLYDARFVSNYCGSAMGYGAFPGDDDSGMMPVGYDETASTGTVTGASSKNPIGRQR